MTWQEALRYYEGDIAGSTPGDPFWADPKAYCTINSLLFPGTRNEFARAAEGKKLNPSFLGNLDRTLDLYHELLAAFAHNPSHTTRETYRVDRLQDYLEQRDAGYLYSFTSTSTTGFLTEYGDKKGLALMHFTIPAGTPAISLAEALPHYAKADEAEILLSPFLRLITEEKPVPPEYLTIRDADGNPPQIYCEARVEIAGEGRGTNEATHSAKENHSSEAPHGPEVVRSSEVIQGSETPRSSEIPLDSEAALLAGQRLYLALNEGETPDDTDCKLFAAWKQTLQNELRRMAVENDYKTDIF